VNKRLSIIGVIVILVAGALVIGQLRRLTAPVGGGPPPERVFSNLQDFVDNEHRETSPLVVIGIDGASWHFIDQLIEKGELPNFARLKREGAYGTLRSLPCSFSPPAWVSMFTGYLPESTGIRTFGRFDRTRGEFLSVTAEDIEVPSVWDVASYAGDRVGVVNVPMTYPVHPLNGIMISGLMTPIELGELTSPRPATERHEKEIPVRSDIKSYSPVLRNALDDSLNSFQWTLYDTSDDGSRNYDEVAVTVRSRSGAEEAAGVTFPVGEYSPWLHIDAARDGAAADAWCKMKIVRAPDGGYRMGMSPLFFSINEPYAYPPEIEQALHRRFGFYLPTKFLQSDLVPDIAEEASRCASYLQELEDWNFFIYVFTQSDNIQHLTGFSGVSAQVYRTIDRHLGMVMDALADDGTLVVASDHGFGKYRYGVDLNRFLDGLGLVTWTADGKVDYARSLVFHNLWHLYFNDELLTGGRLASLGIDVPPDLTPTQALMRYVASALDTLSTIDGEHPIGLHAEPLQRIDGAGPDMFVYGMAGDYIVDFWNVDNPKARTVRELTGAEQWEHERDGIVALWGSPVKRGHDIGATDIQNVAPTLLYLLDLPIAADMDGRVISGALRDGYLASKPRLVVGNYSEIDREALPADTGREDLEKKLRSLGYIR